MAARVRIYTKQGCEFSESALMFLEEKGIPVEEIDITDDAAAEAEMVAAAGGARTTPQIFIDGEHIGGFDELVEEDAHGRLAMRLASGLEQPDVT
jgi:glutaredoxin 3